MKTESNLNENLQKKSFKKFLLAPVLVFGGIAAVLGIDCVMSMESLLDGVESPLFILSVLGVSVSVVNFLTGAIDQGIQISRDQYEQDLANYLANYKEKH